MAGPVVFAFRQKETPEGATRETLLDAGKNPPYGAVVTYYLPKTPEGDVTLTFLDEQGKEIRQFSSQKPKPEEQPTAEGAAAVQTGAEGLEAEPALGEEAGPAIPEQKELRVSKEAGMRRFVWNLRYPDAHKVPGDKSFDEEEGIAGPMVPPGRYQVRLTVDDQSLTEWFDVVKDPRVPATQDDLEAQFQLLLQIWEKLNQTHDAINQIRDMKQQVDGWERRLADRDDRSLRDAARELKKSLTSIEEELIQPKGDSPLSYPTKLNVKLATLSGFVDSADAAPTKQTYEVFEDLSRRIDAQFERLQSVTDTDVAAFNRRIHRENVPAVGPTAPAKEAAAV
jgi:hypothetical protein